MCVVFRGYCRSIPRVGVILVALLACTTACRTKEPSTTPTGPSSSLTITVAFDAATVVGGTPTSGTVTLAGGVPSAGLVVSLTSSDASATVPPSVTVAAQATGAKFSVSTNQVPTA